MTTVNEDMAKTFMNHPPRIATINRYTPFVAIVSARISDLNVAEDAKEVCIAMNIVAKCLYNLGVSGIEGALPSVIDGLIGSPVIAVPTSVGYGANFQGLAALLGMLNSDASGVVVLTSIQGFLQDLQRHALSIVFVRKKNYRLIMIFRKKIK